MADSIERTIRDVIAAGNHTSESYDHLYRVGLWQIHESISRLSMEEWRDIRKSVMESLVTPAAAGWAQGPAAERGGLGLGSVHAEVKAHVIAGLFDGPGQDGADQYRGELARDGFIILASDAYGIAREFGQFPDQQGLSRVLGQIITELGQYSHVAKNYIMGGRKVTSDTAMIELGEAFTESARHYQRYFEHTAAEIAGVAVYTELSLMLAGGQAALYFGDRAGHGAAILNGSLTTLGKIIPAAGEAGQAVLTLLKKGVSLVEDSAREGFNDDFRLRLDLSDLMNSISLTTEDAIDLALDGLGLLTTASPFLERRQGDPYFTSGTSVRKIMKMGDDNWRETKDAENLSRRNDIERTMAPVVIEFEPRSVVGLSEQCVREHIASLVDQAHVLGGVFTLSSIRVILDGQTLVSALDHRFSG